MTDGKPFPGFGSLDDAHAAGGEAHDHRKGHLACPVCSLHDHSPDGRHPEWCQRCKLLGQAVQSD